MATRLLPPIPPRIARWWRLPVGTTCSTMHLYTQIWTCSRGTTSACRNFPSTVTVAMLIKLWYAPVLSLRRSVGVHHLHILAF